MCVSTSTCVSGDDGWQRERAFRGYIWIRVYEGEKERRLLTGREVDVVENKLIVAGECVYGENRSSREVWLLSIGAEVEGRSD